MPIFSRMRAEPTFSGSHVAVIRCSPAWSKPKRSSAPVVVRAERAQQ